MSNNLDIHRQPHVHTTVVSIQLFAPVRIQIFHMLFQNFQYTYCSMLTGDVPTFKRGATIGA
jgi:hypothetical protein